MILGLAVIAGILSGLFLARWKKETWQPPALKHSWLVLVFFLPQLLAFYLPSTRNLFPDHLVPASLVISQLGLLAFCTLNWRVAGMPVLTIGLLLNLAVILANGGFMPISTETVSRLVPPDTASKLEIGERLGASKDILLAPDEIVFPWLADRFAPPDWIPYRFAFSVGDIFIGLGAFILLAFPAGKAASIQKGSINYVNQPDF